MLLSFLKTKIKSSQLKNVKNGDNLAQIKNVLNFLDEQGQYPDFHVTSSGVNQPKCIVDGKEYLMFCSNDYLSLSQNENVKAAGKQAMEKYGLGPGGSRVVNGNIDVIEELESEIAKLVGAEDCLTFPTGYMANVTVFQSMMDPFMFGMPYESKDSVIFSDEFNHGSIVDGCRLTKAKKVVFKHGDCSDLRQKIKENNLPNKLIVTEGVFTPEGELTDIPEFVKVAKETGSKLMIDDAHGIGVLGENGGGSIQHFGCEKDVDIIMGSMDKAFGGIGGYLCGKKELIKYLRVSARSSLLSSSYPAAMAGAMLATVKEIRGSSERREELFAKAKLLRDALKDLGFKIMGNYDLPAIPLFIGDENKALEFNKILWEKGIYGMVFRWPAVPMKKARMRITVMHGHSEENIKSFVGACKIAGKKTGLIS